MSKDKLKHCMVFGCGKELPEGTKIPVCDHHRDKAKDKGKGVAAAVVSVGVGLALYVLNTSNNPDKEESIQAQEDELFEGQDDQEDGNA